MNKLCYFNAFRKATTSSSSSSSSSRHGHNHYKNTLLWFSSAVKTLNPPPEPNPMVEYLIKSCGLSPESAKSKRLPNIKSPSNPDSILRFLRQSGFTGAHITKLVSKNTRFLYSHVDKTLKPKFDALREAGFSRREIVDLVSHSPTSVWRSDLRPRLGFWKSLLGTNDNLLKATRRDNYLLTASLVERILPNVSLLRDRGVPDCGIARMILTIPRLVTRSPESFEAAVKRAEELGFSAGSRMFFHALQLASCNTRDGFDAKFELMKSLGWSESDVVSALKKQPKMFNLGEENIRSKVEFFMEEVGFEVSCLVNYPVLLNLSLGKRLRPRHSVMRVVKGGEVPVVKPRDFLMSEKSFLEKYVDPHKGKVPGIYKAYVAACAGKAFNFPSIQA